MALMEKPSHVSACPEAGEGNGWVICNPSKKPFIWILAPSAIAFFFFLGPSLHCVAVDKKVGLDRPSASLVMVDIMPPWELSRCFNVEGEALNNFSMSQDFSSTPGFYCCLRSLICVTVGNENNFAARTDWVGFRRHRKRNGNHRRQWPWRKGSIGAMFPKLPSLYLY